MRSSAAILIIWVLAAIAPRPATAQDVPGCGSLENAFGPFDYRDPAARGQPLHLVESRHFTPDVQALVRGSTGQLIGDLDYTLRAFPNHYRALSAVAEYALRGGKFLSDRIPSADCYFERAIAFRPDDAIVRVLFANYLVRSKRPKDAEQQYDYALRLAPDSADINYNAGLFFLEQGNVARARQLAQVAYSHGYPLPGLRDKLDALRPPKSQGH